MALYDEKSVRGRVSIHVTSDSEGVCDVDNGGGGDGVDDGGESLFTEDDIDCAERGGGGVYNIIQ